MKTKLIVWSIIYIVGVLLLVSSGFQVMDWVMYVSIILGLVGLVYTFTRKERK